MWLGSVVGLDVLPEPRGQRLRSRMREVRSQRGDSAKRSGRNRVLRRRARRHDGAVGLDIDIVAERRNEGGGWRGVERPAPLTADGPPELWRNTQCFSMMLGWSVPRRWSAMNPGDRRRCDRHCPVREETAMVATAPSVSNSTSVTATSTSSQAPKVRTAAEIVASLGSTL